jgi:hypothetical protein
MANSGKSDKQISKLLFLTLPCFFLLLTMFAAARQSPQQPSQADPSKRFQEMSKAAEARGLAEPFKGITTNGTPIANLFPIRSTGVSTEPVRKAADAFLASLNSEQRARTVFEVDDPEWRKWMNQHFYVRQGVSFKELSDSQREAAINLLRASLSARGLQLTRDIMRLNHTLGELNNNDFIQYGEWLYHITVMGKPSDKQPWGWQLDGHHANINYFVLGNQVVMTPTFLGSEPVIAHAGKFKGTAVLQDEQNKGLAMMNALSQEQRQKATIQVSKTANNNVGEAFKDNVILDYAGIRASEFSAKQKEQLLELINQYVSNLNDKHAKVKMEEVRRHIENTYFAWIGGSEPTSVFYYRIQSPVILVEFDHQTPANLRHLAANPREVNREHIHTVVRTPNGNDYGKDLLKQHYEKHPHPHKH